MTTSIHDLNDAEARTVVQNLNRIMQLMTNLAGQGMGGAHEAYCLARDARDLFVFDTVSRDAMQRLMGKERFQNVEVSDVVRNYILRDQKIYAIKQVREETHIGLKEAKDWVEAYQLQLESQNDRI